MTPLQTRPQGRGMPSGDPLLIPHLTGRERQLLGLLKRGLKNREIAESMAITSGTTKQYINRLFSKLGVSNRIQALSAARSLDMVS